LGVNLPADDYDESSYEGTESDIGSSIVSDATVSMPEYRSFETFRLY